MPDAHDDHNDALEDWDPSQVDYAGAHRIASREKLRKAASAAIGKPHRDWMLRK